MDPLTALPAEIVLRIIDFTSPREVASMTRLTKAWHEFIECTHQDAIYSSTSMTERPANCRDFSFLEKAQSFAKYFHGVQGWRDACKRQLLLNRAWHQAQPVTNESVLQIGNAPIWRFRPDFKRRFFLSTSQAGGLSVTDMDDGSLLWQLSDDEVRPYAHLEYEDGVAAWDRWGNAIEIWQADESQRGVFRRTAILPHDCETRGFQLSYKTLCVVSSEGEGFVYDMTKTPPHLKTNVKIETEAVGHLYQNEDTVVYSLGKKGYHFHSKETGELTGVFQPHTYDNLYHIRHPSPQPSSTIATALHGPTRTAFPPQHPSTDRLLPLKLERGPHPDRSDYLSLDEDEWGAGMMLGNHMVGVSRGGRVFICSDWKAALTNADRANATCAIIECETDSRTFDLGGWLSIRNGCILFEVDDRAYVFNLGTGLLPSVGTEQRPIHAITTSSAPQLTVPVSFMAVFDDCIMTTYTVRHTLSLTPNKHLAALPPAASVLTCRYRL